jgi:hypothetical protein
VSADYGCAGNIAYPPQSGPTVDLQVTVLYFEYEAPLPNIPVSACDASDLTCANPLATGTSDTAGTVALRVPNAGDGFRGFLYAAPNGWWPQFAYWSSPLASGSVTLVMGPSNLAGPTPDPGHGVLWIFAEGCSSTPAFGASLSIAGTDSRTQITMTSDGFTASALTTFPTWTGTPTDVAYAMAFVNDIPVGNASVTTTYGGARVGNATVPIRDGALVSLVLGPTP